jgi:phage terminase large subunit-like protein
MKEAAVNKKVEEYLLAVDYNTASNYVPSEFALEFVNFVKLVNGANGEEHETPVVHYRMLDELIHAKKHVCNMCARGLGKTSLLGEYLFLYLAVYGELPNMKNVNYALYVSDSIENGVKKMRLRLERRWQNSSFLRHYIPETKFTDIRWYFKNRANREFVVTGHGAQTGVRGPLALDEVLYTDKGRVTMRDVQAGEWVYTPAGYPARILGKSAVLHDKMYELKFEDGRRLKVSAGHLNSLWFKKGMTQETLVKQDVVTEELLRFARNEGLKQKHYKYRYYMRAVEPVRYSRKDLLLDPYLVGILLGDGSLTNKCAPVGGLPGDILHYVEMLQAQYALSLSVVKDKRPKREELLRVRFKGIKRELTRLGMYGHTGRTKSIPPEYLFGSVEQRKRLLAGLLDTDGTVTDCGTVSYSTISPALARDVQELGRSLGMRVSCSEIQKKGNRFLQYRLTFTGSFNPFSLPRKAVKWKHSFRWFGFIALVDITEIPEEPSQCIMLDDPAHEFVTTGYIPTHNTSELNTRPQLAVLDDLISDEDAKSPTILGNIEDTVYSSIEYALHPSRNKIIWSGTPFNAKDPLYKAVESGAWAVNVYPICEKFPCTREDFRSAWPDRFPYEYVENRYEKALLSGRLDTFNQEMMLQIMSDEDRLIDDADITWYKRGLVLDNKGAFNFYITTDFATTERSSGDFSVISVWAYNNAGDWLWVDGICRRQLMNQNIDDLFKLVQEYRPQQVGIEITGQQQGFISWIQGEMITRNIYFTLASEGNNNRPGIRPNTNKMQRFNVMVPLFKMNKIWFPEERKDSVEIREAMNEISLASANGFRAKHDDFLDTISMLASLKAWKPSQVSPHPGKEQHSRYWEEMEPPREDLLDRYLA